MPDKRICTLLSDAIKDETDAVPAYEKLIKAMEDAGELTEEDEKIINRIIAEQKNHRRLFEKIADEKGCVIEEEKHIPLFKMYELPVKERARFARKYLSTG